MRLLRCFSVRADVGKRQCRPAQVRMCPFVYLLALGNARMFPRIPAGAGVRPFDYYQF
jgi:hypothetical protein